MSDRDQEMRMDAECGNPPQVQPETGAGGTHLGTDFEMTEDTMAPASIKPRDSARKNHP